MPLKYNVLKWSAMCVRGRKVIENIVAVEKNYLIEIVLSGAGERAWR